MNVTRAPDKSHQTITVIQGDFAVSADPNIVLSTVLGSCVAVCLYDATASVGGMNHFLLASSSDARSKDLRYGVNAMELLINRVLRAGGDRGSLQAKIFGGAKMTTHAGDIGRNNADFALEFLTREGISCVSQSLGGDQARRVQFTPTTGAARQLQIAGPEPALKPMRPPVSEAPDITLF
ncbi:chemotaxis protein CheD [Loktanella sp. D2R18]|uniref:chemotaxis protein CheD n=1 Tax=Rhodobacterales TaxID=204455 RepID=UPI000DE8EFF2|nr:MULTISPECIES: chemotaxis protein CheD [Rhodobacterales]MDO6590186.1 chemotaxis protein CheD [Yoonia sp. 1_MG-2023]RBW42986.1 chemotaxis protein CheD [Loktanella sp. D2R18]